MNLRTKLWLGTGLLYILTLTVVALSLRSVMRLTEAGTHVIAENYRSLVYMHRVDSLFTVALHAGPAANPAFKLQSLQALARLQSRNITEKGEKLYTDSLNWALANLATTTVPHTRGMYLERARSYAQAIEQINLRAMEAKSNLAEAKGADAMQEAILLATIVLIVVVTLAINFPFVFVQPLERLTRAVQKVGEGAYGTQVEITDNKDELGRLGMAFNAMSSELARYSESNLERILSAQRRTESIINRLHEPLIVSDADQKVLFFNQAARQVLGTEQPSITGLELGQLAQKNDLLLTWMKTLDQHPASQEPVSIVVEGKERFYTMEAFAIGEKDSLLGYVFSMADVTRFKDLDRARADFLATVAHELKTPVSTINLSANLLSGGKPGTLNSGQGQILQSIRQEGDRLLSLVNSLLELSRTESASQITGGQLKPIEVSQILEALVSKYEVIANEKGVNLELTLPPQGNLLVHSDHAKLELILSNLLSNAIRYTPETEGKVQIGAQSVDNQIQFFIQDNGPGIGQDERTRIFERFYKGASGGTGLGLYIAHELSAQIGAHLRLDESATTGARFVVEL